jgi:hypothetical protein
MQNPFRDGGPLDVAMGLLSLLISIALLWKGIQMAQNGASWWWPLTPGVMVALAWPVSAPPPDETPEQSVATALTAVA